MVEWASIPRMADRRAVMGAFLVGLFVALAAYVILLQAVNMIAFAHEMSETQKDLLLAEAGELYAGPVLLGMAGFALTLVAGRIDRGPKRRSDDERPG